MERSYGIPVEYSYMANSLKKLLLGIWYTGTHRPVHVYDEFKMVFFD
jgi:hypothetical protein